MDVCVDDRLKDTSSTSVPSQGQVSNKTSKELLALEYVEGEKSFLQAILHKKPISQKLNTFPLRSKVLSQVKDLLPQLQESNEHLRNLPQDELDIENVDSDGPVIEMSVMFVPDNEDSESTSSSSSSDEEEYELHTNVVSSHIKLINTKT